MPAVLIMESFAARDIKFQLCLASAPESESNAGSSVAGAANVVDAFARMREGSRRLLGGTSPNSVANSPLSPPAHNMMNAKIQLELDVLEVFEALGLEAPNSQHEYLKKMIKVVVNFMWYIDPYHHVLHKLRQASFPREFQHLVGNVYNNYKEKKQKPPPLQASTLEGHVNELFSVLALPALKLPCNTRSHDALCELANLAAMQVSQMKRHAQSMRTRREHHVVNDGKIAISLLEKKSGPFHREVEKKLIRDLRSKVNHARV